MAQSVKLGELAGSQKRRARDEDDNAESESEIDIESTDSDAESLDEEEEVVNIDFDFFNGNPNVDFHALKNLMRQLFGPQESNRIQLSQLADLILESPTTTIKADGPESDPYSFLSFINYNENKDSDYAKYLVNKVDPRLTSFFQTMDKTCALVVGERIINMPPEVIAPLYNITLEDVASTLGDSKHYDFYVIVSRKYEVNFETDDNDGRTKKKVKADQVDYFHEEDRFFEKHAKLHFDADAQKGIIRSYTVLDHNGLIQSIEELQQEISTW